MKKILRNLTKIIITLMVIYFIINIFSTSFATINISSFSGDDSTGSENISSVLGQGLYIFQVIGFGISIIMLIALAIKYMISSVSERAEIKKHAVIYVVGAVLIFGAAGISSLIREFALGINDI